jgi:hypothetical protein
VKVALRARLDAVETRLEISGAPQQLIELGFLAALLATLKRLPALILLGGVVQLADLGSELGYVA